MSAIQDSRGSSPNGVEDPWKGAIGSFSPSKWIVDAASARALIASGAMVIRARGSGPKASRPFEMRCLFRGSISAMGTPR